LALPFMGGHFLAFIANGNVFALYCKLLFLCSVSGKKE
jgi:hypothetical protein